MVDDVRFGAVRARLGELHGKSQALSRQLGDIELAELRSPADLTLIPVLRKADLAALQGADIVCVPTNWVPIPGQAPGREAMANILAMAAAHSNSIYIACADRVGTERGQPFEGQSLIVGHTGWPVAGPASRDKEEIVIADVALGEARRARNWNAFNQVLRDRRSDLYDEMLGSDIKRGWY